MVNLWNNKKEGKMNETYPFTLYWPRHVSKVLRESICKNLGITRHMTVNRETVVWLTDEQRERVREVEAKGFVVIRSNKMS